ncbi:hypothetical protein B0H11DRAFT_2008530 [Mycena galericulata]|nr:hypothetical protein B0H11DRAFT_2008530 [Mycena galericulata]
MACPSGGFSGGYEYIAMIHGNVSKNWNEHNSFLVRSAGLPREESQKEYNIRVLSTSNIAPPLEMLDGIVEQLEASHGAGPGYSKGVSLAWRQSHAE